MNDTLKLIDHIYAAAEDHQRWVQFADELHQLVGVQSVNLVLINEQLPDLLLSYATGASEADGQYYQDHVYAVDETLSFSADIGEGEIHDYPEFFDGKRFEDLEATKKFYARKDWYQFKVAKFMARKGKSGWLTLVRGKHDVSFDEADQQLLQTLMPHLARAYSLNDQLLSAHRTSTLALDTLDSIDAAILLLDDASCAVHTNARADQLFRDGILRRHDRGISLPDGDANKALQASLEQIQLRLSGGIKYAFPNTPIAFHSATGKHYIAYCIPYRNSGQQTPWIDSYLVAALFILDGEDSELIPLEVLSASYSLTNAEARVLQLILNDCSTAEIAEQLQTSKDAVRFHLKNLFRKTGTGRQAELVGLVLKTIGKLTFSNS